MARKPTFGDDVRKRAIELRSRGMVTSDIIVTLKKEFGAAPASNWVNEATRGVSSAVVDVATAAARASELVARVESQPADGGDINDEALRDQLRALKELQQRLCDNPQALSSLSGALIRTVQALDRRTPPPPPEKEIPPEWEAIGAAGIARMHSLLDRVLEQNGQPCKDLPSKT